MSLADTIKSTVISLGQKHRAHVENPEVDRDEPNSASVTFDSDRGGGFFSPRSGEEDDDFPEFTGEHDIVAAVKKAVGPGYRVSASDHEKGMFTVTVSKEGKKATVSQEIDRLWNKLANPEKDHKAEAIADALANNDHSSHDEMVHYLKQEFGMTHDKARKLVDEHGDDFSQTVHPTGHLVSIITKYL